VVARMMHVADLDFGAPFVGIGVLPDVLRAAQLNATADTWDAIVDIALEESVDVVLAVDVTASAARLPSDTVRFAAGLERLSAGGIGTIVVNRPGRMAPVPSGWRPPDGVSLVADAVARRIDVECRGVGALALSIGFPWPDGPGPSAEAPGPDRLRVAVDFAPQRPAAMVAALPPPTPGPTGAAPGGPRVDYWALGGPGDGELAQRDGRFIVRPGPAQPRTYRAPRAPAGVVVVEAEGPTVRRVHWHRCAALDVAAVVIDLAGIEDADTLIETLEAALRQNAASAGSHPAKAQLLRGVLAGQGPLRTLLGDPAILFDLLDELRDRCGPSWWWSDLYLAPRPIDDALIERTSPLAPLLRHQLERTAQAPPGLRHEAFASVLDLLDDDVATGDASLAGANRSGDEAGR